MAYSTTTTRGHILLMNLLHDLSQAYAMLLQEENQQDSTKRHVITPEHVAMNARFSQSSNSNKSKLLNKRDDRKNNDVVYDYCKYTGHSKEKCFALHGYPEWHILYGQPKPKPKFNNNKKSAVTSTQINHSKADVKDDVLSTTTRGAVGDNLSDIQCQQLIQMLQAKLNPNSSTPWIHNVTSQATGNKFQTNSVIFASPVHFTTSLNTWIIDSGATHHITSYIQLVTNSIPITSDLYMPNGKKCCVSHIATIYLDSEIVLKEVVVTPNFQCNLLSVAQLTHDTSYTVMFSSSKCQLQDLAMNREKEIGKLSDGLYKFVSSTVNSTSILPSVMHSSTTNTSLVTQWYWRLSHPSLTVLKHIKSLSLSNEYVSSDCEICHLAKQVRLSFSARESRSTAIFDVVNCDVWGPYKHTNYGHCNQFLTIVDDFSKCTWLFLC